MFACVSLSPWQKPGVQSAPANSSRGWMVCRYRYPANLLLWLNVPSKSTFWKNWHRSWKWSHLLQEVVQTYSNWVSTPDRLSTITKRRTGSQRHHTCHVCTKQNATVIHVRREILLQDVSERQSNDRKEEFACPSVLKTWRQKSKGTYKSPDSIPASFASNVKNLSWPALAGPNGEARP